MRLSGRVSLGWQAVAVLMLVLGASIVPMRQVAACSCAMTELPQAIEEAEVAIIGTLAGAAPAPPVAGIPPERIDHVWLVERARDPMSAITIQIAAWSDDGANCGITFAADERWLVLAHQGDGGLETNGCMRNVRLADALPEEMDVIDSLVANPVAPGAAAEPAPSVPAPLLVALGALAVVAAVSFLAFRRAEPGESA
jgi:hypothetical protein